MKTLSDFELEEYQKMLSTLELRSENEDKSHFFNAWSFGKANGNYVTTNNLYSCNEQ